MQSINSLTKSPINISIFSRILNNQIFEDVRAQQLFNIIAAKENIGKYSYAFYTDSNELKENLFIPVFHTVFLGCVVSNVILENESDLWVEELYPHNKYYVIDSKITDFSKIQNKNIHIIKSILEIGQ